MRGAIPPLPQYVFMAWCLVKHRDKFTLTLVKLNVCHSGLLSCLPILYQKELLILANREHICDVLQSINKFIEENSRILMPVNY
jgi:hypothetical protein